MPDVPMRGSRSVRGDVVIPNDVPAGGTVRVRVEDVSRADAASVVVAEDVTVLVRPVVAGERLPFACAIPNVDEQARYSVRVHIDRDGTGAVKKGDLISTQSYPTLTHGAPDRVEVAVVQI